MLRVAHTVYTLVDQRTAEAAVDADRSELLAQRLQQFPAQVLQRKQLEGVGGVVHVVALRPCGACHLVVTEMLSQLIILSFLHVTLSFNSTSRNVAEAKLEPFVVTGN